MLNLLHFFIDTLPCNSNKTEYSLEIKGFEKIRAKRCVIYQIGVSASAAVNGRKIADLGLTPMVAVIS